MPGSMERHLDEFGFCSCGGGEGTEKMVFEEQDEITGRWRTYEHPACAACFGLL